MTKWFKNNAKMRALARRLAIFSAILGPGIITGSVDNDVGGITTYSVAGALYGYNMLWTLIPSFLALVVVQEMNARMGMVTGKGLADLIRESFGVRATFFIFVGLLIVDIGNTATEFAGVAGAMEIFGVSKYVSVPCAALFVWLFVLKSNYKKAEKIFLLFSLFLFSYVVSALMAKPDWAQIGSAIVRPRLPINSDSIAMILGLVGTTIAPWMQFYMQSSVIEKGLKIEDYKYSVTDVVIGCVATIVVAFFIIIACAATLHVGGIRIEKAADAAMALKPLAGAAASYVFAFGLLVAAIFSATILPLATSFYICEAFGFEAGIDKTYKEAPQFYKLYTSVLIIAVVIILIPSAPLVRITLWTQVLNGILLPIVLISMIRLVTNPELMGPHVSGRFGRIVGWGTVSVLVLLSTSMLVLPVVQRLITQFIH
jgi:NRAMP (natural resistance-associated macrophage protein)-like metal ion transporter